MIIAVSYKDNEIFEHFGHAEMFAIYKTNDDNTEILSKEIVEVKETGHQAVADLMDSLNVDAVIVGNIGVHARGGSCRIRHCCVCRLLRKFRRCRRASHARSAPLPFRRGRLRRRLLRLLGRLRRSRP